MPTDRIYLRCGATDMRRGINSLARMVQQVLALNPHTGAIFCFRGRKGHKRLTDELFCLANHEGSGRPVAHQSKFHPRAPSRLDISVGGGAEKRRSSRDGHVKLVEM
ncbi:hypothetical protein D3227_37680 [Mesorhizobium waimense]|uniref:Transposase n=1 Tax=Mesorhizobium waimense TaxID=1300307 RepID=A0A3A5K1F2_9HYPH|nr:hypothetical protein D3227_37680 [Mesorhizobium waimense]